VATQEGFCQASLGERNAPSAGSAMYQTAFACFSARSPMMGSLNFWP
jgi:hypothetical protein